MSTYVLSDIHGRYRTLNRLLEQVGPHSSDEIWVLGDMIDCGPEPVEVMRLLRCLPNFRVLMGDHEDMMLRAVKNPSDELAHFEWMLEGGGVTLSGLSGLGSFERNELLSWVDCLPAGAHVRVGGRSYVLVHAGLRPLSLTSASAWSDTILNFLLKYQDREDLLRMRDEFWGAPTGFIGTSGRGPIVVAGHTPVPEVEKVADTLDRPARDACGECQVLHLGATASSGFVADRWAIDCGAQGGAGWGRVAMVRLDDGMEFYSKVLEGE